MLVELWDEGYGGLFGQYEDIVAEKRLRALQSTMGMRV